MVVDTGVEADTEVDMEYVETEAYIEVNTEADTDSDM